MFSFCTGPYMLCSWSCLCGLALGLSVELSIALFYLFLAQLLLPPVSFLQIRAGVGLLQLLQQYKSQEQTGTRIGA